MRHLRNATAIGLIGLFVAVAPVDAAGFDTVKFQDIATRLVQGLSRGSMRIALRPFGEDEVPVSVQTAGLFNDALLSALQDRIKRAGLDHRIVARAELKKIFREAEEFYDFNLLKALEAAKADVLIIGKITRAPQGGVFISFRANAIKSGRVLAGTEPVHITYDVEKDLDVNTARTLEQVIEGAVNHFARELGEIKQVRPKGLHYANSGVQTRFGEYATELFLDALQKKAGTQGWQPIGVEDTTRKISIQKGEVDQALVSKRASDYLLHGSYWDLGRFVELRLRMKNASGRRASYKGLVNRASLGDSLAIEPDGDVLSLTGTAFPGPLGLYLSSDRGNNPVYRIGDEMHLLIQTSEDAYLYCFHTAVDGSMVKLFPNAFVTVARLSGGFLHRIPGRTMPFRLKLSGPAGFESVRCFATDRDIGKFLPEEVRANKFATLSPRVATHLHRTFRGIPDVRLSEATMMVTLN